MKLQAVLEEGETDITPFRFAEAVTEFFLISKYNSEHVHILEYERKDLEEVIDYLNVFRSHHPIEDYTYVRKLGEFE